MADTQRLQAAVDVHVPSSGGGAEVHLEERGAESKRETNQIYESLVTEIYIYVFLNYGKQFGS